jgi:ATP-binding cassette subfamily B protein
MHTFEQKTQKIQQVQHIQQEQTPRKSSAQPKTKSRTHLTFPWFKRQVPVLLQMNEVECGLACLAMIFSYHGRKTSVSELRTMYGVSRDGLSALSLVKAARSTGMIARAISLQQNDFKNVTLPAIIHWQFNHFMVVERWTPTKVTVIDPAIGRRHLTAEEFSSGFTGIVMSATPSVQRSRSKHMPANHSVRHQERYYKCC